MRILIEFEHGVGIMDYRGPADGLQAEIERSVFPAEHGDVVGWKQIQDHEIPADRTFRGAWRRKGDGIGVDMPAAREIHKDRLRRQRARLMPELDAEYIKADEKGDKARKQEVAQEKQRLRDITADPRIEAAQTPEDLLAISL